MPDPFHNRKLTIDPCQIGIHELIQIAIHNRLNVTGFFAGTQIFYHAVRMEYIRTNLASPSNFFLYTLNVFNLFFLLLF